MAKGILGRKLGMTQIFDAAGNLIPVTIIDTTNNVVLQQRIPDFHRTHCSADYNEV